MQSDASLLTTSQWIILSNLIHSYDNSKLLSIAQRLMQKANTTQSFVMSNTALEEQFFKATYQISGDYLCKNGDVATLLLEDNLSKFLHDAVSGVHCVSTIFTWSQSELYTNQSFLNICTHIYGEQSISMIHNVMKFIDPDVIIVRLALSLIAFSNHSALFSSNLIINPINTNLIFQTQNGYAEVTWKYLLYKYDHYQAVIRFNRLIKCLLATMNTISESQNIETHVNDMDSLVEQTEIACILLQDVKSTDCNNG